jgi:pimeloyl-ACP methyl ester carboxylesterase
MARGTITQIREGAMLRRISIAALPAAFLVFAHAPLGAQTIATESFTIPSSDPGIQLYLRNKHTAGQSEFPADKIILFVHGATFPSETGFDLDLPGGSWMDYVATRGYDAYLVDIRGYGRSTRPAAMDEPADKNPPFATTDDAIKDVSAAVDFILKRRNAARLNLLGWSWGTTIMAGYTADNNDKVNKLVLYAPLWTLKSAPPISGAGAYRMSRRDAVRARVLRGIPAGREEEISPTAWFDKWWAGNLATDPVGSKGDPPFLRSPNGVIKDIVEHWGQGKPLYDPSKVRVPTLLIVAEWDQDTPTYMAQEIFAKMTAYKRLVILGEGTHAIALETNRMRLLREVQHFLDEPAK